MASLTSAKKHAEMKKKEAKIDECRARRTAFLEARRQQVRDLRNNKVAKKGQPAPRSEKKDVLVPLVRPVEVSSARSEKKEAVVPLVQPAVNFGFQQGFWDMYKFEGTIKKGGFGTVFKVRSRSDLLGLPLAVKVIRKTEMSVEMAVALKKEVTIMAALKKNAHVVRFYGVFEDQSFVFILMELIEGKEMTHQPEIKDDLSCDESTAKKWLHQLLTALDSLHAMRIAHRDIKLDNVMFDKSGNLKLIDFGLSDVVRSGQRLTRMAGTPGYIAPEVFENSAGLESDLFSVGALLHLLLTGDYPFPDGNDLDRESWKPDPRFGPNFSDESVWGTISYEARDFIKGLLQHDPCQRMTASQALAHKWLSGF